MKLNKKLNNSLKFIFAFTALFLMFAVMWKGQDVSFAEEEKKQPAVEKAEVKETVKEETVKEKTAVEKVLEKASEPKDKIKEAKLFDIYAAISERSIGNPKAPITVIEYASMTCPHCAKFHTESFSEVKKQYIDTDKVYWVFREFPLDKLALKASMMARCVAPSMYFNLLEVLFNSQSSWIGSDAPMKALERTGKLAGMNSELFEECINNQELELHVLKNMQTGQGQWAVKSTPTFVINYGVEQMSGARTIEDFQEVFDKLLQKQGIK